MEQDLEFANNEAIKGYVDSMRRFLDDATEKSKRLRTDISYRIKDIEHIGYTNAVKMTLDLATDFAQKGNRRIADLYLQMAEQYALRLDSSMQAKVKRTRTELQIEP